MSRRRRSREVETFGLSFLDAICCGFGAIVLLLVITKTAEPTIIKEQGQGMRNLATELADRLPELEQQRKTLSGKLAAERKKLAAARAKEKKLQPQAAQAAKRRAENALNAKAAATIEQRLAAAKQKLTTEMERLNAAGYHRSDHSVGGIPVDSQYIVFVIDTSGSMHGYAWPLVIRKLRETLAVYPKVKGMQVMSDQGDYMFPSYAGQWIPDTPGRRKVILQRMTTWQPFSNSSPVQGIERAIGAFGRRGQRVSIYVFGDEFTGDSIQRALNTVARLNPKNARGQRLVRIHAIGFPTQFGNGGQVTTTGVRFATLMRKLCIENGGTFVGLNSLR